MPRLVLLWSKAAVRNFSQLNNVKNKTRNCKISGMMNSLQEFVWGKKQYSLNNEFPTHVLKTIGTTAVYSS